MVPIPHWLHSTFKELSNESLHAQIQLKRRSYGPDKLEKKKWLLRRKNVTTKQKKKMSRQSQKLCQNADVVTQNCYCCDIGKKYRYKAKKNYRDRVSNKARVLMLLLTNVDVTTQILEKTRKVKKLIFWPVFKPFFYQRTINTNFLYF